MMELHVPPTALEIANAVGACRQVPEVHDIVRRMAFQLDLLRLRQQNTLPTADPTPITEEWAATVRGEGVQIMPCLDPYNEMAWLLSYHDECGWEMVRSIVKTQGAALQILSAVRPTKGGG